jgi:hypothetical protein
MSGALYDNSAHQVFYINPCFGRRYDLCDRNRSCLSDLVTARAIALMAMFPIKIDLNA